MVKNKPKDEFKVAKGKCVNYKKCNIQKEYDIKETIGGGAFAKVVKVLHKTAKSVKNNQ